MGSQKQRIILIQLRSKIQYSSGELKTVKITEITNKALPVYMFFLQIIIAKKPDECHSLIQLIFTKGQQTQTLG